MRARELALIKEIVLLFVRVWFEYAGAAPDDDPDASANADIRFQRFLEMLAAEASWASRSLILTTHLLPSAPLLTPPLAVSGEP